MKTSSRKISLYRSSSLTIRLIGFMIIIAVVLLISFSVPVLKYLNKTNDDNRRSLAELNAAYIEILTQSTLEQISSATIDSNIIAAVVTPDSDSSKKQSMAQVSLSRLNNSDIYTDELALFISDSNTIVTSDYAFGTPESKSFEYAAYFLDNADRLDFIKTDSHRGSIFSYDNNLYMALEFPQSGNKRLGIIFAKLNSKLFTDRISSGSSNSGGCFILGSDNSVFAQTGNIRNFSDFASEIPPYDPDTQLSWSDSNYSYTIAPIADTGMRVLNADSATYGNTFRILLQLLLPVSLMVIVDFIFLIILFNDKFMQPLHRINKSLSDYIDGDPSDANAAAADISDQNEFSDIEKSLSKLISTHREQGESLETVRDELLDRLMTELISGISKPPMYYSETLAGMHAPIDTSGNYCLLVLIPDNIAEGTLDKLLTKANNVISANNGTDSFSFVCFRFSSQIIVLIEYDQAAVFVEASEKSIKLRDALTAARSSELFYDIRLSRIYGKIEDTAYIYSTMFDSRQMSAPLYGKDYFTRKIDEAAALILSDHTDDAVSMLTDALETAISSSDSSERQVVINCYIESVSDKLKSIPSSLTEKPDIGDTLTPDVRFSETDADTYGDNELHSHIFSAAGSTDAGLTAFTKRACLNLQSYYDRRKNKYVAAAIEYVDLHYQEPELSLERTAEALGIHFNYLSRVFKTNMGESFTSYVGKYRIDRAKSMLAGTSLKISDIASMTGFGSQQNFTKVFKKYELITPGRYRETMQKGES